MHDYKFRGKTKKGEWVYGSLVVTTHGLKCMPHTHTKTWIVQSAFGNGGWFNILQRQYVLPETVGQYTGLKDKNGKEIYEGDIVVKDQYLWFDNGVPNYRGTVEWVFSQWQVIAHCINPLKSGISDGMNYGMNDDGIQENQNSKWEVIGNTHDNSDLLK